MKNSFRTVWTLKRIQHFSSLQSSLIFVRIWTHWSVCWYVHQLTYLFFKKKLRICSRSSLYRHVKTVLVVVRVCCPILNERTYSIFNSRNKVYDIFSRKTEFTADDVFYLASGSVSQTSKHFWKKKNFVEKKDISCCLNNMCHVCNKNFDTK